MKRVVLSSTFAAGLYLAVPMNGQAALGDQPLAKGMDNPDVKDLQEALRAKGYFQHHTSTGYYGSITAEAVKAFQKAKGLPQTGQATLGTIQALLNEEEARGQVRANSAQEARPAILRQGAEGAAVRELQQQLKQAGYFTQGVTGYYGRITTEAVRSFQRSNGLTVDGVAGPQTFGALQNATAVKMESISQPTQKVSAGSPAFQTLRIGARGDSVRQLQTQLNQLGFLQLGIDGQFGPITERAVREFQRSHKITVDGIVGPQTLRAIEQAAASKPGVTSPAPQPPLAHGTPTLRNGSQGEAVTRLQSELKRYGFFRSEPTGYYGSVTTDAVRAFQRQHGLTADGIAGAQTWNKLNELNGGKGSGGGNQAPKEPTNPSGGEFNVMNLIADASEQIGVPYVWGGTTPSGFDCSGFLNYVFHNNGVQIPRTVAAIWDAGRTVSEPRVGDLVFFETYTKGPSHAGIYIGNQQFIHSGSSSGVTISNMTSSYWNERYLGVKRYF